MKPTISLLALVLLANFASAQLKWETKEMEFFPAVTDPTVKAEFNFTNIGHEPITISSVEPGCDCTTAQLEKASYAPGEKGRIAAVFTIGARTGLQMKPIRVVVQGEKEATTLTIVAHVIEVFRLTPQIVFWEPGDKPEAKMIELTAVRDSPIHVTKATSSDPAMTVMVRSVQPGKAYQIVVTPESTDKPMSTIVTIEADLAPDVRQVFTAYAHVKHPPAEPAKVLVYDHGRPVAPAAGR